MKNIYHTETENGAIQFNSTGKANLDLFASIGSCREMANNKPNILKKKFFEAFYEDPKCAIAILFWVRAVRNGAGERKIFEVIVKSICNEYPAFIIDNLSTIVELGRWKDLAYIYEIGNDEVKDKIAYFWASQISTSPVFENIHSNDFKSPNALACKWLPKKSKLYRDVQRKLTFSNKQMRQHIARYSNTVEQKMCAKNWKEIDYSKIPSQALNQYKNAFIRNDEEHFIEEITTKKINAGAIYPHEILWNYSGKDRDNRYTQLVIEKLWKSLPNFINPEMRFIPVVDGSYSMTCNVGKYNALYIARALGLYCAEHLEGMWKNKMIVFSSDPRFIKFDDCDGTLYEKNRICGMNDDCSNTDIMKVFRLILDAAKSCEDKSTIPNTVLILSDMQFDMGTHYNISIMDSIRSEYKKEGIEFPSIIYWNLYDTNTGFMDSKYDNVSFVSGYNPKLMQAVFKGMKIVYNSEGEKRVKMDPIEVMRNAIEPIMNMIDYTNITQTPSEILKDVQLNTTIGQSIRTTNHQTNTFVDCVEELSN